MTMAPPRKSASKSLPFGKQNTPPTSQTAVSNGTNPPENTSTTKAIVLAGNPNVGKSLFFNHFTGMYVNVSNFPGTTVDIPKGIIKDTYPSYAGKALQDTPGVYGMSGMNEEETVASQAIMGAEVIINVVSAISLERDLFLTQQIIDYGKPLVVALNQMDEAEARELSVDAVALEKLLGVPVIPTTAVNEEGLSTVLDTLEQARTGHPTPDVPTAEALQTLELNAGERIQIYGHRRHHVNQIVRQVVRDHSKPNSLKQTLSQNIGNALLHPVTGMISMLLVLLALYQIVGVWVAGDLVDLIEGTIMLGNNPDVFVGIVPVLSGWVAKVFAEGTFFHTVLGGEFGVLTMSIQYIFGVLFPLVLGFYIYISLLEDCGYLPRIAVLSDGLLNKIGLNGRAIIPIILGFGCVTMATVSTRVLNSQRERTIASTILAITIPCSAQLAVIMALMAVAGGLVGWAVYIGILFATLAVMGTALNMILPGKSTALVMDLPPMRLPTMKNIAKKSWVRTKSFLFEAAPLFVYGSLLVAVLQATGTLDWLQVALGPVTTAVLKLPGETAQVFIMGMVRRDFGAAGLLFMKDALSAAQILTALVVITLFVPCLASAAVIWKERGVLESMCILAGSWLIAFGVGAIVARVFGLVPFLG